MHRYGYVYMMTNQYKGTLYVGMTSNLRKRVLEHKTGRYAGFTQKYSLHRLVYYEQYDLIVDAIAREKQLKAGSRKMKIDLIQGENTRWIDLAHDWYGEEKDNGSLRRKLLAMTGE